MNDDGMTQTERTLKAIRTEWITAERNRILTAIEAIDDIEWALGAAYDMVISIVRDNGRDVDEAMKRHPAGKRRHDG